MWYLHSTSEFIHSSFDVRIFIAPKPWIKIFQNYALSFLVLYYAYPISMPQGYASLCSRTTWKKLVSEQYHGDEQSLKNINQTAVCRQICIRNDIFQARRWEDVWWSNCVGKDSAEVGELQPVGKSLPAIYFCK